MTFMKASEKGDAEAQFSLGLISITEEDGDIVEAREWRMKAALQGHAEAQFTLAELYDDPEHLGADKEQAEKWYEASAEQLYLPALLKMGKIWSDKVVSPRSDEIAKKYFQAASIAAKAKADEGDAEAQFQWATMLITGKHVEQSIAEGVDWLHKAAAQDHPDAAYALAILYADGRGVPRNMDKAHELYRKAASLGHEKAQNLLQNQG